MIIKEQVAHIRNKRKSEEKSIQKIAEENLSWRTVRKYADEGVEPTVISRNRMSMMNEGWCEILDA